MAPTDSSAVAGPVRARRLPAAVEFLAVVVWAAFLGLWATLGSFNADESFYALASQRASAGGIPYRDFGYTQMPLLPFLNIPWHSVFGYTIAGGRAASFVWALLTGALLLAGCRRLGGGRAGAAALLLLVATGLPAGYFVVIGKTYAAASAFLLAAAWALFARVPVRWAWWLIVTAGTIAIGIRLTVAPCVFVLWCGFAGLRWRALRVADFLALLVVPGVLIGPFYWAAPENAAFWTLGYHLQTMIPKFQDTLVYECLLFIGGALPLSAAAYRLAWLGRRTLDPAPAVILTAGWAGVLASVVAAGTYGEYFVPFLALVFMGSCAVLWRAGNARYRVNTLAICVGVALALDAGEFSRTSKFHEQLFSQAEWTDLKGAADFLAAHTKPDSRIAGSMVEVAMEAGRPLASRLELGKFAITASLSEQRAADLHLLHWNELLRRTESTESEAWVMSTSKLWSYGWTVPTLTRIPEPQYQDFANTLMRHYDVAYYNASYVVLFRKSAKLAPVQLPQ